MALVVVVVGAVVASTNKLEFDIIVMLQVVETVVCLRCSRLVETQVECGLLFGVHVVVEVLLP